MPRNLGLEVLGLLGGLRRLLFAKDLLRRNLFIESVISERIIASSRTKLHDEARTEINPHVLHRLAMRLFEARYASHKTVHTRDIPSHSTPGLVWTEPFVKGLLHAQRFHALEED